MRIESSRRSRKRAQLDRSQQIHRQLARARGWQRRWLVASSLALATSLASWILGFPFLWQGLFVLLTLGLGLLLPVGNQEAWALDYLDGNLGLSYRTALEHSQESERDPYGFSHALRERSARQLLRLEPPERQPWWLLPLILALTFVLLPRLSLPGLAGGWQIGAGLDSGTAPTTGEDSQRADNPSQNNAQSDEAMADSSEQSQSQNAEPIEEQATAQTQGDSPQLDRSFDQASPDAAGASALTDEETLDRFLDNLRERPEPQNPFEQLPQQQAGGGEGQGEGEEEADVPQWEPGQGESASEGGEQGETPEAGEQGPGEQQQAGEQGNGEQEGQQAGGEGQNELEQQQLAAQEAEGNQAMEEGEEGMGMQPQQEEEGEAGMAGQNQGEEGDGAGNQATQGTPSEGLDAEGNNEPELLEGDIEDGPINRAGEVRMPGQLDEAELPAGQAATDFEQAAEQAITEGRIPVSYQEILRNYFR